MAKTKSTGLERFEGKDVLNVACQIRNTGDGLSEAMSTDKIELHHGDKVYVVLECDVEKVRFDPIKDTKGLARVHMLKAETATIVDEALVAEAIAAQIERNEQAAGVHRLDFGDDDADGDDGSE